MPRIARVVVPDYPHHIIQRGNRGEKVFFNDNDKQIYLNLLYTQINRYEIEIWGYCLMDNHVHFIAVPKEQDSFAKGFGEVHKQYASIINSRKEWKGHLWGGRFKSCVLSESHLYAALRYIEQNPVKAGIVKRAEEYLWSSARDHVFRRKNKLLADNFVIKDIVDWKGYLTDESDNNNMKLLIEHTNSGRPLGDKVFVERLESLTQKVLQKKKPGPKVSNSGTATIIK